MESVLELGIIAQLILFKSSQLRKMMTASAGKHGKADLKQQPGLLDGFVRECVERRRQYEAMEDAVCVLVASSPSGVYHIFPSRGRKCGWNAYKCATRVTHMLELLCSYWAGLSWGRENYGW